ATPNSAWRTRAGVETGHPQGANSMRPRRIRRGEPLKWAGSRPGLSHSMRPRRIRRGEPAGGPWKSRSRKYIQCVHAEFGVENQEVLAPAAAPTSGIQFGHAEFGVENR